MNEEGNAYTPLYYEPTNTPRLNFMNQTEESIPLFERKERVVLSDEIDSPAQAVEDTNLLDDKEKKKEKSSDRLSKLFLTVGIIVGEVILFGLIFLTVQTLTPSNNSPEAYVYEDSNTGNNFDTTNQETPATTHEHIWKENIELIEHGAESHTVVHPALYSEQTSYHSVCNVCGEVIDGAIDDHEEETGHRSWTTDVPFIETVLENEEWEEVIIDKEAYTEEKIVSRTCETCGKVEQLS